MIKPTSTPDKHQHKIAVDTVRNPMKGVFMGGMSEDEAIKILKTKFKYSDAEIKKLQEHRITSTRKLQESAIRKIHKVLIREAEKPREGTYAYGTMTTMDGKISGEVDFNGLWNKFQVSVDGVIYGEYRNLSDAIDELKAGGFKNVEVFETPLTYQQLKLRRKKDGVV